jgi:DNA-binding YbaB/EbfC family protein
MKDLNSIMKQAQAMQQKLQDAQARLAETTVEGAAGAGLVTVTLSGAGELKGVAIDPSLLTPDEGEVLADLLVAAHADAKRRLDEQQQALMRETMGPLAGMAGGMPGFPGMKF